MTARGPADVRSAVFCYSVQGGQERCHLLPFKEGRLWVLLLVSAAVPLTPHTLAALQAAVGPSAQQLAAQVRARPGAD